MASARHNRRLLRHTGRNDPRPRELAVPRPGQRQCAPHGSELHQAPNEDTKGEGERADAGGAGDSWLDYRWGWVDVEVGVVGLAAAGGRRVAKAGRLGLGLWAEAEGRVDAEGGVDAEGCRE